jgi:tetratricopeptide (TPR) repeat protein
MPYAHGRCNGGAPRFRMSKVRKSWMPYLLVVAVIAVYGRTVGFPFMRWDDYLHVVENPGLNPASLGNLAYFWRGPHEGLYIPMTYTAWSFIAALSRRLPETFTLSPFLFHAANVGFHLANAFLVRAILSRLLGQLGANEKSVARGALAGALLFALHPIQVENVSWITGFKDVFFGFLALLAVRQYLADRATGRLGIAFALSIAATLAKPSGVVLPLVLGWLEFSLFKARAQDVVRRCGPWFAMLLPLIVLTKMLQPDYQFQFVPTFGQRWLVAGDAISFYFAQILFPLHLLTEYHRAPVDILGQPWVRLTALAALLPLALVFTRKYARGIPAAGVGIFLVALLPVLGFVPFGYQTYSTVADRYAYFPMLGLALLAGGFFAFVTRREAIAGASFLLAALGVRSQLQTRHWESSRSLSLHTLRYNPDSFGAHLNLGIDEKDQDIHEAQREFEIANRLRPNEPAAYVNLGSALGVQKKFGEAAGVFAKALELDPNNASAQINLARALVYQGKLEESGSHFQKAIELSPRLAYEAHLAAAQALAQHGYVGPATLHFREVLRVRPADAEARIELGTLMASQGHLAEALEQFQEVMRNDPENPVARENVERAQRGLAANQSH